VAAATRSRRHRERSATASCCGSHAASELQHCVTLDDADRVDFVRVESEQVSIDQCGRWLAQREQHAPVHTARDRIGKVADRERLLG
jgi:hypothetical protein